jgi:D-methionine transport system permease protein
MIEELLKATIETLYMTFFSALIAFMAGLPLGILLYLLSKKKDHASKIIYTFFDFIINIFRSIPFIILIILLIPLTKLIAGTIIGANSAIVSLSIAAIPFMARLCENSFNSLSPEMLDTASSMGMTTSQLITKVLIPESLPEIISNTAVLIINLITYTAIAGAVGAGGLGAMAINYGYQRFRADILLYTVSILVIITQLVQFAGTLLAKRMRR